MLSMVGYKSNKLADCPFILNQYLALISQLRGLYVNLKEFDIHLSQVLPLPKLKFTILLKESKYVSTQHLQ